MTPEPGAVRDNPATPVIHLQSPRFHMEVSPRLGASVLTFDLRRQSHWVPVLAPLDDRCLGIDAAAMFPMAPFANRARDNALHLETRSFALQPNTDDPLALHGVAWQRAWSVTQTGPQHVAMRLDLTGRYPLTVAMTCAIALIPEGARFALTLQNTGAEPVPVGMGFHPYFPRRPDTRVAFAAEALWPEGAGHLPRGRTAIPGVEDYKGLRPLPDTWRNQCYSGWSGSARIVQPSLDHEVRMTARGLEALMMFATPEMDRFALEPQSHVSGETRTGPDGLMRLDPGQSVTSEMTLEVLSPISSP
ncbi:hypothetical protein [Marinovum sp.]|uniref:aldose epimerase family protein n=1 Tax=Marinovum sp. TaxID=2024839 RepID=UPI003A8FCA3D